MDPDFVDFLEILSHHSVNNQRSKSATAAQRKKQKLILGDKKVKRSESQANVFMKN